MTSEGSPAADDSPPPVLEIVDRSDQEDAEEIALSIKDKGNKQLLSGHFLEAIRSYSEALEYTGDAEGSDESAALVAALTLNKGIALCKSQEDNAGAINPRRRVAVRSAASVNNGGLSKNSWRETGRPCAAPREPATRPQVDG